MQFGSEATLDMLRVSSFNCSGGKSLISSEDPNVISSSLRALSVQEICQTRTILEVELKGRILRCSIFGNFLTKSFTSSSE